MEIVSPNKVCLLCLLLPLAFLCSLFSAELCNPRDQKVLLKIKNRFHPAGLDFLDWNPTTNPSCCNWSGIKCDANDRVTFLSIPLQSTLNTSHEIPPAIGDLPLLEHLSIDANLTGPIPQAIARLTNLLHLDLSYNRLTGPVPDFLGRLERLTYLALRINALSGPIPSTLGQLTNLTYLDLSLNMLTGPIPDSLGQLNQLVQLDLSTNRLSGHIPPSLSHLTRVTWFDLESNMLTGPIPPTFGSLKSPEMLLLLSRNRLTGPIPRSLGEANIKVLTLSMNHLTGDASFLFGREKTALEAIYLNDNHFKFNFSNVDFPQALKFLDISHNEIYGSLPKRLGQLQLQFFNVSYNHLCGMIPKSPVFTQLTPYEFAHNKCLCGSPLPPCK